MQCTNDRLVSAKGGQVRGARANEMAMKRNTRRRPPTRRTEAGKTRKNKAPPRAARLPRAERERHIIDEAIKFFAEVGFGGDTRELAKRLHVTHPLLFRYFPSKDALIERVYQEVYIGRWNPYWELIIADRSLPIRARMVQFYRLYAKTILAYEWVRLFMFSGLKGADMNRRWFALVGERIVVPLCREIRAAYGLPEPSEVPLAEAELELVWGVNSRVFYFGVRKYVYGMQVPSDIDELIEAEVDTFFDGVVGTLKRVVPALAQPRTVRSRALKEKKRARVIARA
jgi:AcrR family transcriptional regulator